MTANLAVSSNAFGSASFVNNGVDPRTGQYTVSVNLPDIIGNSLCGPALPIALSFNPINKQDSGFGIGWNLSFSQYNPLTRVLSLQTGETYLVTGGGAAPEIAEHKLQSFKFFVESPTRYRVVHRSGLIEILEHESAGSNLIALPARVISAEGHHIDLTWQTFGSHRMLKEVTQADGGLLLKLERSNDTLRIQYLGGGANVELASFFLSMDGSQLRYLKLPGDESPRWTFAYDIIRTYPCIKSVISPYGTEEKLEYLDSGHLFPGSNKEALPRVTKHVMNPGREQPSMESRYQYSSNNFLGYGAPGLVYQPDYLDNLYRVNAVYEYFSIQTLWHNGTAGRSVKSIYNRYHLLIEQTTRNGNAVLSNRVEYHIEDTLPFDLQPSYCQMPYKTTSRWALADDPTRLREETQTTYYDNFGNMRERISETGARETWSYYSALGEPGCPADPWGFTRYIKEQRRYPAPALASATPLSSRGSNAKRSRTPRPAARVDRRAAPRYSDEPVLINRYTYTEHPPLAGSTRSTLLLSRKVDSAMTATGEQEIMHTVQTYIDAPDDSVRHGKPLSSQTTYQGHATLTTSSYEVDPSKGVLAVTERLDNELDGSSSETYQALALYSGLVMEERNSDGLVIVREHDRLRRLVAETAMPDDPLHKAVKRYRYKLGSVAGQCPENHEVNAQGVEVRTELDGLGRTIRQLRQRADGSAAAQTFRVRYSARYGHQMDLLEASDHDWLGDRELKLTKRLEYDDWDQCCRATDSAGLAYNTVHDPIALTTTEWQDGMAKTVTHTNRFGKPDRILVLGLDQVRVKQQRYLYDGLGTLRLSIGNSGERSEYGYDALGRATLNVLPDHTRVHHEYAAHSPQLLVAGLQVSHGNRSLGEVQPGAQQFDGLARLTHTRAGPRTTEFRYSGSRSVVDERITPGQRRISYDYNLALSEQPVAIHAEDECTLQYHPVTARLTHASSTHGTLEYEYDSLGQLVSERSTVDGKSRENRYVTSVDGRIQERTDFTGLQTRYSYDDHGRLTQILEGQIRADFEYNALGQQHRTTTQDLETANTLVCELEYDDLGREILRVQRLTGAPEHRTVLGWAPTGHLRHRELSLGGELSLFERFVYDPRGRLIEHHCTGPDLPQDRYGNRIREQMFEFDGLDNLLLCITRFADDTRDDADNIDEAQHCYADDDPCQVRCITHTHRDYPPQSLFSYDADGNLLNDTDGRTMHYDSQGRLVRVDKPEGGLLCCYRYDAHDHLQGVTQGTSAETLRFYESNQLRTTVQGDRQQSLLYAGHTPLGQQQDGDAEQTLLTLCGQNNSVMAELKGRNAVKRTQYTSHGEPSQALDSVLGYNGETREADTGWYLLGSGYRAYDPHLRCFHSPDSESPFGAGGLNPYAYCLGNPISFRDPTGHMAAASHQQLKLNQWAMQQAIEKAQRDNAGLVAKMSLVIGLVTTAAFAVALAPFTGGLTMGVAVGIAVDVALLLGTTGAQYYVDKTNGDQKIVKYIDYASYATMFIGFGGGSKKAAKTIATQTASAAAADTVETSVEVAGTQIARGATPTPRLNGRRRAMSMPELRTKPDSASRSGASAAEVVENGVAATERSRIKPFSGPAAKRPRIDSASSNSTNVAPQRTSDASKSLGDSPGQSAREMGTRSFESAEVMADLQRFNSPRHDPAGKTIKQALQSIRAATT
jgi:RHS repeat-associated protein